MKQILAFFFLILFSNYYATATHNRAGQITYEQIDELTIRCQITTYTKAGIANADRDSLLLDWGDGQVIFAYRINGYDFDLNGFPDGLPAENGNRINYYVAEHTYSEPGNYLLSMTDPNRNPNIFNINNGNSDFVVFYLEAEVYLGNENNSSPVLLEAPIDVAFVGQPFMHIPNGFDVDGDSLSYELISPLAAHDSVVLNYITMDSIASAAGSLFNFDESTGFLTWDAPHLSGEFALAIAVNSYRNGELNGRIIRELQILVLATGNNAPNLVFDEDIPEEVINVMVGDSISLSISAMDIDANQDLTVSVTSGLFDTLSTYHEFTINQSGNAVQAQLDWYVATEFARDFPYQITFKVSDNEGAAAYLTVRYRVNILVNEDPVPKEPQLIEVYPNPVAQFLFIKNTKLDQQTYSIWDVNGKIIDTGTLTHPQIDVAHLANGTYFLKILPNSILTFIKN